MFARFTSRKPKPRAAAVAPLQDPQAAPAAGPAATTPGQEGRTVAKSSGAAQPKELGGPSGPEPTRYGDWERKGICVDF